MEIYTSYFGNLRKLSSAGIVPVSIARWRTQPIPLPFPA